MRFIPDYTVSSPQAKSSNNVTSPEAHRSCHSHILHYLLYPHSRGGLYGLTGGKNSDPALEPDAAEFGAKNPALLSCHYSDGQPTKPALHQITAPPPAPDPAQAMAGMGPSSAL
ncbi:hypothetical protein P691DRAFT_126674 [Macrolepiota fuliginosa MF-IS2]|uniref:Uncharacterized protein n=1 Tax=Macrolepiota fuliginosa MF-IS2 TaxID=1400762 RepID=A0A9P6BWE7_9AGAR|nr:hypothetical protein P691DRAFT_126674 [Macrolepiota fuliginosa MF-IS2]